MSKFSRRRNSKKRKSVRNRKLRGGGLFIRCPNCQRNIQINGTSCGNGNCTCIPCKIRFQYNKEQVIEYR
jgi:hypothetical protein